MRMRARNSIVVMVAFGLVALLAGEIMKEIAFLSREEQQVRLKGPPVFKRSDKFSVDNVEDEDMKRLIKADFFRPAVVEPVLITKLKDQVPNLGNDRHFADAWDALWFLSFIGDDEGLYSAIEFLVSKDYFKEGQRCLDNSGCKVEFASSNVNSEDGTKLFEIIDDNFITSAVAAFDELDYETAYAYARNAVLLSRAVDFDPGVSSNDYDRVLVLGTMLVQPKARAGKMPTEDIAALADFLEGKKVDPKKIITPEISAYVIGVQELRRDCFRRSSKLFFDQAELMGKGSLADLFYFMSVRAAARPFVHLELLHQDAAEILAKDCEGAYSLQSLASEVSSRYQSAKAAIEHKGLRSDVDFYQDQSVLDVGRLAEIRKAIIVAQGKSDLEASEAKEADTKRPVPATDKASAETPGSENILLEMMAARAAKDKLAAASCNDIENLKRRLTGLAYPDLKPGCDVSDELAMAVVRFASSYRMAQYDAKTLLAKLDAIGG